MKRILLLIFVFCSLSQAKASDTLTVRQVFNFDVGDTFDYKTSLNYQLLTDDFVFPYYGQTYNRYVISSKILSANSDTVTYIRHQIYPINGFDTIVYTHLDSSILKIVRAQFPTSLINFDTTYLPDGRLVNSMSMTDSLIERTRKYGAGLGLTYSLYDTGSQFQLRITSDTTLIYYAKGADIWGTTYYQYIGDRMPHYTPIPEDCAYWNYTLSCPQMISGGYSDGTQQQVHTGAKVSFNGHSYVELLKRTYSPSNNSITADSTFGYFRNDTIGQKLYFTNSMTSSEILLCDFTLYTSAPIHGNNFLSLDTLVIGGMKRIVWQDKSYPPLSGNDLYYIEGIGPISGFPGQGSKYVSYDNYFLQETDECTETPVLQSFCVCGQTLYPNAASGTCQLLTGMTPILSEPQISISPNPASRTFRLSFSDVSLFNAQLRLTDILGKEVYSAPISTSESTHDISKLAQGMYTWRLVQNNATIKTGKIIKQ